MSTHLQGGDDVGMLGMAHRAMEIVAIAMHLALMIALGAWLMHRLAEIGGWHAWALGASFVVFGWALSDFTSGFVHWLGDSFGSEDMPYLGAGFVKPFRFHHVDPVDITRHDFIETNGNNCVVVCLFLFVPMSALYLFDDSWLRLWLEGSGLVLAFATLMTNQIHRWAHMESPPIYARILQRSGIVLRPDHHAIHHQAPYDTHYCITNGWMNGIHVRYMSDGQ